MKCSCSTISVANYILKKMKKAGLKITKVKLQAMVIFAHLRYIKEHKRPLINEPLILMHFGFILKSISDIFLLLKVHEDIGPRAYTEAERNSKILMREKLIDKEVSDKKEAKLVKTFLDEVIAEWRNKSDRHCLSSLTGRGSVWRYIADKMFFGNHNINDYQEEFGFERLSRLASKTIQASSGQSS